MVHDGHGKGPPYRKVYQVQEEFGPAGVGAEREAPNPNPNDFILVPRYGSKSQQWSAEDVIVGSINERSADGSRNQDHKTNKRWSAEEAVIVSGNILVPRSGSKKSTDGSRDQ